MTIRSLATRITLLALMLVSPVLMAQERSFIGRSSAEDNSGPPFSTAVMADNTLYISGSLGLENGQVPEDPAVEAHNLLSGFVATLAEADMTMDDLVYVTIYCSDLSLYDQFNEIYRTYFTQEFPARAFIGTSVLLRGARFEMQAIAVKD